MIAPARDAVAHAETAARLRVVVARLARQLRQHSPGGLTPSQWSALATVETHGPLRIGDLAEREGVTAPTATRVVASLEDAGLLSRSSDPSDRRTSYIALTDAAREKLESVRGAQATALVQRLSDMSPADVQRLLDLLPILESLLREER
ncbi:MAG TPA: MarR family transcriptional regulator [Mycobacteriales bacterium]|nr:MarR family transcriptional regulator [Mycobacteriales bacterium]HWA65197.1 MarR family transcriptional regulator [Mycobacteriales bacterium]